MRVKVDPWNIYDVFYVYLTPGGFVGEDDPEGTFHDMTCDIEMRFDDGDYGVIKGEFDCYNATTYEECEAIAQKFMDDLLKNGYVDLSTKEKRKAYNLELYL